MIAGVMGSMAVPVQRHIVQSDREYFVECMAGTSDPAGSLG